MGWHFNLVPRKIKGRQPITSKTNIIVIMSPAFRQLLFAKPFLQAPSALSKPWRNQKGT